MGGRLTRLSTLSKLLERSLLLDEDVWQLISIVSSRLDVDNCNRVPSRILRLWWLLETVSHSFEWMRTKGNVSLWVRNQKQLNSGIPNSLGTWSEDLSRLASTNLYNTTWTVHQDLYAMVSKITSKEEIWWIGWRTSLSILLVKLHTSCMPKINDSRFEWQSPVIGYLIWKIHWSYWESDDRPLHTRLISVRCWSVDEPNKSSSASVSIILLVYHQRSINIKIAVCLPPERTGIVHC